MIKFDCSAWLPTSLTQQSNSDDVSNGNGNKVVGNHKEGDGKGGEGNCDAMRVAGKQQQQHG